MATILKFESRGAARPARPAAEDGANAGEVIIFPGVRIEREAFKLSDRLTGSDPDDSGVGRRRNTGGK